MAWTVRELAARAGLSVRALHHYDRLGLLRPAGHSPAGYRLYTEAELVRLHQILFYRAMGLELKAIGGLLDGAAEAPVEVLRRHLASLRGQAQALAELILTCEASIATLEAGGTMGPEHFAHLSEPQEGAWAAEAEAKWGGTEAWAQSQARLEAKGDQGSAWMQAAMGALVQRFSQAQVAGPPEGPAALAAAEAHHAFLNEHCFDCDGERLRALADLYLSEPRFRATYEAAAPGLAAFVRRALHAWADRQGAPARA